MEFQFKMVGNATGDSRWTGVFRVDTLPVLEYLMGIVVVPRCRGTRSLQ